MSSDQSGGSGGGDWGEDPAPLPGDPNIDMNYGQPLPSQQQLQQQPQQQLKPAKGKMENDDIIALVLTFIIPGVGHMMLGQMKRGILILAMTYLTCGAGYLLTIVFAVDAYLVAMTRKYRQVGDWEFLPDMNKHLGSG